MRLPRLLRSRAFWRGFLDGFGCLAFLFRPPAPLELRRAVVISRRDAERLRRDPHALRRDIERLFSR